MGRYAEDGLLMGDRRLYQCERCGGTGRQAAGLWDGTGYGSVAGTCADCGGSGKLGRMETGGGTQEHREEGPPGGRPI